MCWNWHESTACLCWPAVATPAMSSPVCWRYLQEQKKKKKTYDSWLRQDSLIQRTYRTWPYLRSGSCSTLSATEQCHRHPRCQAAPEPHKMSRTPPGGAMTPPEAASVTPRQLLAASSRHQAVTRRLIGLRGSFASWMPRRRSVAESDEHDPHRRYGQVVYACWISESCRSQLSYVFFFFFCSCR